MSNKLNIDLDKANAELNGKTPEEIIAWALAQGSNPIITTNFRPYEVVLLEMVAKHVLISKYCSWILATTLKPLTAMRKI